MTAAGVSLIHVPYRGENLVINDMLGGHVDVFFGNVAPVLPFYRDGKLKVLAITDGKRAPQLPDVPTAAEAGLPGFVSTAWFAVAGPPKMAPALAERIAGDFAAVLAAAGRAGKIPRRRRRAGRHHAGRDRGLHQGGGGALAGGHRAQRHPGGVGARLSHEAPRGRGEHKSRGYPILPSAGNHSSR